MIGIFFRAIIIAPICALIMLAVFFGFAAMFICELASRIIYAKSVINEVNWEELKEAFNGLLKAIKEYLLN